MKVFIVEDSDLICKRILTRLESIPGISAVNSVDNGTTAFDQFIHVLPDLVILDISVPGINGIELLKEFMKIKPDVQVFMFTNYPYHHYKTACLELGAKEFYDKSGDFETMITKIESITQQYYQPKYQIAMSKILVVDDSSSMRKMVIASLKVIPGTTFQEATNGLEAIELISLQHFDLIMLDMNMPDMNGMEVLYFIRSQLTYRQIPVVVLTTRSDDTLKTSATEAGATLYMTKPFDPKVLAEKVKTILNSTYHG